MNIVPIKKPSMMRCKQCHVTMEAACDCNVGYVPAGELALQMVESNPEMSNRAIARELGVAHSTVHEARKSGGRNRTPDSGAKVTGRDGKSYAAKRVVGDPDVPRSLQEKADATNRRRIFMRIAEDTIRKVEQGAGLEFAKRGEIDEEILIQLDNIVEAWTNLRDAIYSRKKGK